MPAQAARDPSQPSAPPQRVRAAPLARVKLGAMRAPSRPTASFLWVDLLRVFVLPSALHSRWQGVLPRFTPLSTRPSLGQPLGVDVESGREGWKCLLCIIVTPCWTVF